METECGHLFCENCYRDLSRSSHGHGHGYGSYNDFQCPSCRTQNPVAHPSVALRRTVDDLRVRCIHGHAPPSSISSSSTTSSVATTPAPIPIATVDVAATMTDLSAFSSSSSSSNIVGSSVSATNINNSNMVPLHEYCSWTGRRGALANHISTTCGFVAIPCPLRCSSVAVRRMQMDHHIKEVCMRRATRCEYCSHSFPLDTIAAHLITCKPIPCVHSCGIMDILPRDMERHEAICSHMRVPCSFASYGCQAVLQRKDVSSHLNGPTGLTAHMKAVFRDEVAKLQVEFQRQLQQERDQHALTRQRLETVEARLSTLMSQAMATNGGGSAPHSPVMLRNNSRDASFPSSHSANINGYEVHTHSHAHTTSLGLGSSLSMSSIDSPATMSQQQPKRLIGPVMPSLQLLQPQQQPQLSSSLPPQSHLMANGISAITRPTSRSVSGPVVPSLSTTPTTSTGSGHEKRASGPGFLSGLMGALSGGPSIGAIVTTRPPHDIPPYQQGNDGRNRSSSSTAAVGGAAVAGGWGGMPVPVPSRVPAPTTQPTLLTVKGAFDDGIVQACSHIIRGINGRMPPHTLLSADILPSKIEEPLPCYAASAPAAILFWKHVGTRCMADNIGSFVAKLGMLACCPQSTICCE
jgi:hypothetical protein